MRSVGYTLAQMKEGEYTATELKVAKYYALECDASRSQTRAV